MKSKILLLSFSIVVVGMFAMPGTLSLFAGQHTFVNGSDVDCKKCHIDIYEQIVCDECGTVHNSAALTGCKVCHRTGSLGLIFGNPAIGISGNNKLNITNDPNAHAAVTVECIFCHDLIVEDAGSPQEILGSDEAHSTYYNASNQSTLLKGGNEACIGCHTHTMVNVTWVRKTGYDMEIDILTGTWNLSYSLNQSTVNTTSAGY